MKFNIDFTVILFLVFLTLKLMGVIAWSWWWVTAPLWIPWAFFIVVILVATMSGSVRVKKDED